MSRFHLDAVVFLLAALGLSLFAYKATTLKLPLAPGTQEEIWIVEAEISFQARGKPTQVSLFIPRNAANVTIMDETFVSQGYGLITKVDASNRIATWSIRKAHGRQSLYYRVLIRRSQEPLPEAAKKTPKIEKPEYSGAKLTAADALIADATEHSADLDTFVLQLIRKLKDRRPDDNTKLLVGKSTSLLNKLEVCTELLAHADHPARIVHGVSLLPFTRSASIIQWLEVYDRKESAWRAFDFETSEVNIPSNYLAWWWGPDPISSIKGSSRLDTTISVERSERQALSTALEAGKKEKPLFFNLSLFSLPLQTQAVYRVMLLVPLGALIVILLRNVVGIKTFGTFMPILIALSFRETELLWGIGLFVVIVGVGLLFRFYLEKLKLLFVPRIACVLTAVVLLMLGLSIVTYNLGITRALSIALFPMVIIAMTIERMSIVWEEDGSVNALLQGAGSLFTAAITYYVFSFDIVQHVLFVFPEILLLVLALMMLLGRYTGYRLLELFRFRDMLKVKSA